MEISADKIADLQFVISYLYDMHFRIQKKLDDPLIPERHGNDYLQWLHHEIGIDLESHFILIKK